MISKKEILRLYKKLENYQAKLAKQEPYWTKCTPCVNKGECCINSHTTISSSEYVTIKDYIINLPENTKAILKNNINKDILCPFRTEEECLIHEVRPLICRMTPYLAKLQKLSNKIEYLIITNDCTKLQRIEQDIIGREALNHYKSNLFVDLCINPNGKTRKYMNMNYLIANDETYDKLSKEKRTDALDLLKVKYSDLFL